MSTNEARQIDAMDDAADAADAADAHAAGDVASVEVTTPCRLHFGLLALSRSGEHRQFGGAGLMIRRPEIAVRFTSCPGRICDDSRESLTASGPLSEQAQRLARAYQLHASQSELALPVMGGHLEILRAPRAHTGLGTGTQLGMAIATALSRAAGVRLNVHEKAALVQRGKRSAIGAYGFEEGGYIVEGGKLDGEKLSPKLIRQPFPEDWRIVLICPDALQGLAGARELQAFAAMQDIPQDVTARMCQLVLLSMTPAIVERDLPTFGQSLYELQRIVGQCFSEAQGGIYAHPSLDDIVAFIRKQGIAGVGQSSWGPTLYAVTHDEDQAAHLAKNLRETFSLGDHEVTITQADNRGSVCDVIRSD